MRPDVKGSTGPTLSVWRDRFVFTSPRFEGEESCRPAIVIVIGTDGVIELRTSSGRYTGRAFLIGANIERSLKAAGSGHYSLNLDPSSAYCRALRRRTEGGGVLDLSDRLDADALAAARASVTELQGCAEVYRASQKILLSLVPDLIGAQPMDARVDVVASWLWAQVPNRVDLTFLANLCGLSKSRLAHLFTDEMGISIRQYLLWVKMRLAAEMFVGKYSLAHVAHEIGFSDSAHLSRTFTRYFALTPSYLANDKLVRMQVCGASKRPNRDRASDDRWL